MEETMRFTMMAAALVLTTGCAPDWGWLCTVVPELPICQSVDDGPPPPPVEEPAVAYIGETLEFDASLEAANDANLDGHWTFRLLTDSGEASLLRSLTFELSADGLSLTDDVMLWLALDGQHVGLITPGNATVTIQTGWEGTWSSPDGEMVVAVHMTTFEGRPIGAEVDLRVLGVDALDEDGHALRFLPNEDERGDSPPAPFTIVAP